MEELIKASLVLEGGLVLRGRRLGPLDENRALVAIDPKVDVPAGSVRNLQAAMKNILVCDESPVHEPGEPGFEIRDHRVSCRSRFEAPAHVESWRVQASKRLGHA